METNPDLHNPLYGKTILWNGDSICAGSDLCGSWATRIARRNAMSGKNYAIGGGTITGNPPPMRKSGKQRHSVCETLDTMYVEFPDADYIILEGGTNDADLMGNALTDPSQTRLGTFQPLDFSGSYDTDTFCGALEDVFYRTLRYWNGKKVGFVVAQKMGLNPPSHLNRRLYFDEAVKICIKWGIPYIDLWNGCCLNPALPWMYDATKDAQQNREENVCFYADGQHLTGKGYDFTADILEKWLKSL